MADTEHSEQGLAAEIQALRRKLPTLDAVERRRRRLWTAAGLVLVATSAALVLQLADDTMFQVVVGGAVAAFLLYVSDQERRLRRLSGALTDELVLSSQLNERVRDLSALSRVGQVVNSNLTTDEVLRVILRSARELTGAAKGSVMLVDRGAQELVVEVASGGSAAPVGARQPLHTGVAGRVAETRQALLISGDVGDAQVEQRRPRETRGGSSVIAPMIANDVVVGILSLEREQGHGDFTQLELRAVSLFAGHAATAVTNARRYEAEQDNVVRLAELVEQRSAVVATLVQDLKAPLSSILGDTRLLATRGEALGPQERREAATRIELASEDLLGMIDQVLDTASFAPSQRSQPRQVALEPLLDEVVEDAQQLAAARDGRPRAIRVRVASGATARTDPTALRSVLESLLENAVRYSPPGTPVEVTATVRDGTLEVAVSDQGRGIAAADQDRIFERFRQQQPDGQDEGIGLGLYVARSLVTAQGGDIQVESAPGNGATFRLRLPEPAGDAGSPSPPRPPSDGAPTADTPPRPPPSPPTG